MTPSDRLQRINEIELYANEYFAGNPHSRIKEKVLELIALARQPLPFHAKEETPKPDDICILICGRKNRYVEIGGIKRGMYETADGYQLAWDEVHGYILRSDLLH